MISTFSLEFMHLMCLGVMNKPLSLWLHGRVTNRHHFLRSDLETLGKPIRVCSDSTPCGFQPLCRLVDGVNRWKATEFCMFLCWIRMLEGITPWWWVWASHVVFCSFVFSFTPIYAEFAILLRHLFSGALRKRFFAGRLFQYFLFCTRFNSFARGYFKSLCSGQLFLLSLWVLDASFKVRHPGTRNSHLESPSPHLRTPYRGLYIYQCVKWPKSKTLAAYQRMLLNGDYAPDSVPSHGLTDVYHCGKNNVAN